MKCAVARFNPDADLVYVVRRDQRREQPRREENKSWNRSDDETSTVILREKLEEQTARQKRYDQRLLCTPAQLLIAISHRSPTL